MIRIVLNGQPIDPRDIEGEQQVSITITVQDNETQTVRKKASNELTIYGASFAILKAALIDPIEGRTNGVPVKIYDDCTEEVTGSAHLLLDGLFRGAEASWCQGDCFIKVTAIEETVSTRAEDCLKSTLIADNRNGFKSQVHPRMVYCDQLRPGWLHHTILALGSIAVLILYVLTPVVLVITVIIDIINVIIDAVNVLPGVDIAPIDFDGNASTDFLQEYAQFRQRLIDAIIGCGAKHPSPLVRSYLNNVCSICGLTLQSSIFTDPASDYYNTVLLNAPTTEGTRDNGVTYIDDNEPYETGDTFLQKLAITFNARRRIIGSTLYFERKDHLPNGTWIDPQVLKAEGRLVGHVCYKWNTDPIPAFATVGFTEDALDTVGNEARGYYKDIVEWNNPYLPVQTGERKIQFPFGMLRCRRDGGSDILEGYTVVFWMADPINQHSNALLLERGLTALPKLIVWDGNIDFGLARRFDVPGYFKPFNENYNFPFHVNEFNVAPNTGYPQNAPNMGIYGRFHAIENPKVHNTRGVDFDFTFEYNANDLLTMNPFSTVPVDPADNGTTIDGEITSITINVTERTILVAGKA